MAGIWPKLLESGTEQPKADLYSQNPARTVGILYRTAESRLVGQNLAVLARSRLAGRDILASSRNPAIMAF
jgi:hypothetical protein